MTVLCRPRRTDAIQISTGELAVHPWFHCVGWPFVENGSTKIEESGDRVEAEELGELESSSAN
jgi:hypothetical protein